MKLPGLEKPDRYVGLYVVDFGESSSVGFTAQEVAELLESEKYKDCKVYKIHNAYPDGRLELKGVRCETFQLEAGMFFYETALETSRSDYENLVKIAVGSAPPCRAKLHLAKYSAEKFVTALIYPAEHDDEISRWLLDNNYRTTGSAEGGTGAVQRYYDQDPEILERHQLFAQTSIESRTGTELLANLKVAVQR
jgi:hypothetical protein